MAMRDLVAADCGGANPLTKLSRHFAKDESRRLIDQGTRRGQFAQGRHLTRARAGYLTSVLYVGFNSVNGEKLYSWPGLLC